MLPTRPDLACITKPSRQNSSPQPCPCACPPLHTLLLLPGALLHQLSALLIYTDRLGDSQTAGPHAQHALCSCSPPDPSNTRTQVSLHMQNKERGGVLLGAQRAEPGPGSASPEPAPRRPWPCWERHAAGHAQLGNREIRKIHIKIPSQKSTQRVFTNAQLPNTEHRPKPSNK